MAVRSPIAMLLVLLLVHPLCSQAPLSPAAAEIRTKVNAMPIGGRLTVNMRDGTQYCGSLSSIDAGSFSLREVDLKTVVTVRYEDVQRVRENYGRRGLAGRRVHPRTNLIAAAAVLGGLLVVVVALLASDKS